MGIRERTDYQFGKRVREERDRRGWTQEELAKRLSDRGIPVYPSTIAKIESEKRPRAARLGEVVGIADLFQLSTDALLGRQRPDESSLAFALVTLMPYVSDIERRIQQALGVLDPVEDQVDLLEEGFDLPNIGDLKQAARDMTDQLESAHSNARKLSALVSNAIAASPLEVPEKKARAKVR